MLTSTHVTNDRTVVALPTDLHERLQYSNLAELARRSGVSRNTLMAMRDTGRASRQKIEQLCRGLSHEDDVPSVVTPVTSSPPDGRDNPSHEGGHQLTVFLEWAEIKSQLDPVILQEASRIERLTYQSLTSFTDPFLRYEQSIRITKAIVEGMLTPNESRNAD